MRAALETELHKIWAHRGPTAILLYPLSLIYQAVARARSAKIKPVELPVPVVVVGLPAVPPAGWDASPVPWATSRF